MKAKDLQTQNKPPSIVIVGPAGCGKTALCSQLGKNAFCFDFDDGMRTCLTLQDKFTSFRQSIDFEIYRDSDPTKPDCYVKALTKLRQMLSKPPKAVLLDSLTGLASAIYHYIMLTEKHDSFAKPEIQNWGSMVNETERFILMLRSLKCPIIMTAHEGLAEMEGGASVRIINSITKSHGRNKVAWLFDEVWYMQARAIGAGKFGYFVSGRSVDLPCRTRSGILSDTAIDDKGLQGLLEKLGYSYMPESDVVAAATK
jgi:hypothetical protein